jgi:hypothetical protein
MKGYFPRMQLDELAKAHGTDKSSLRHDYMRFYEFFIRDLKNKEFTLLELGVGPKENKGKSLATWRDYFPKAQIVGVDIRADAKEVEGERVRIEIGDCSDAAFVSRLASKYKPAVIIDDASHRWSHQISALEGLFQCLMPAGIFIVEDLHTSFLPYRDRAYGDSPEDTISYLARLAYLVSGNGAKHPALGEKIQEQAIATIARGTDAISFYRRTALLAKR